MSNFNTSAYSILAPIYDDAGFANYAGHIAPEMLTFLQQNGWLGRRILDLGCGTGSSTAAFAQRGFNTTAIELNPEMLRTARMRVEKTGYLGELAHGDITTMDYPGAMDLVCFLGNGLNDMSSLRDIEAIFQKSFQALEPTRRFVFDMLTLKGLGEYLSGDQILDISGNIYLTAQSVFNYDTMSLRQHIVYFREGNDDAWQRHNAYLTLRGFPVTGLTKILEKVGFNLMGVYDTQFNEYDPSNDSEGRVIFICEKPE